MLFNRYQTPLTEELLKSLPDEVLEQLIDVLSNIEFIRRLVSPDRPYAKDLPRDEKGRIIVDITNPHIIEDADYFRPAAIHYLKHGCYTMLRPNSNPNSEYRKFWDEERRRCWEGYVRESDGEWVTGMLYWFLNYCPMMVNEYKEGSKKAVRKESFPFFFEGIYWRFHYLELARQLGKHAIELAKRGCAKSYGLSSILSHNLILGENEESRRRVISVLTAYEKEYLSDSKDGTLSKFRPLINFIFSNTPFPRLMLKNSPNEMTWQMGYKDEYGIERGSLNLVIAVSAKDNSDKLRGKRGWILFEEMGNFKGLLELYDVTRKSVEDGDYAFALMYLLGTANNKEADFSSAKTLLYNPLGYRIHNVENVYDKLNQGRPRFGFFFPSYINRAGCYNKDGVSDVTKALILILMARHTAKYSADPLSVLRVIAEDPITPAEAIIKVKSAYFPVAALTERLGQLDSDPRAYDDVYIGNLALDAKGEAKFNLTSEIPIRDFPVSNDSPGAIEIFNMPETDSSGKVYAERYIVGHDPVSNDMADSASLSSTFVLDLFTDKIVAEYTGRKQFAEDSYEVVRLLCLFYNAKCLYEAHPYDLIVRTPAGTKLWGDILVGDILFAPNGKTVKVAAIPIDGIDDIYKITFADGRTVEASRNHIWQVTKIGSGTKLFNVTTEEMIKQGLYTNFNLKRFFVPEGEAVEYPHRDTPIDPYTLGLLIAEGAFTKFRKNKRRNKTKRHIQFSSSVKDAQFYKLVIPYPMKHVGTKGYSWHLCIDDIDKKLEQLGLLFRDSETKFIPELYLYNDYNTRLELLKGLMDGDGCAVKLGASVYITVSEQLKEDLMLLCRSLGIKCWENKGLEERKCRITTHRECSCKKVYRVCVCSEIPVFKLPRKVNKLHIYSPNSVGSKAKGLLYKNGIASIEYIGKKRCKCATVDSEDGLYLIGDYIVTHNCNIKGVYSYFSKMNCTHLLADTPQYLRDKLLVKYSSFGSAAKGVTASAAINNYANGLIRDWLLKPVDMVKQEEGEEIHYTVNNLFFIRNRALLRELIDFNPEINVDRIRALGMAMLYREEKMILYNGDIRLQDSLSKGLESDDFFEKNYRQFTSRM